MKKSKLFYSLIFMIIFAAFMVCGVFAGNPADPQNAGILMNSAAMSGEKIGSGDGLIHIIPALSSNVIKNGNKAKIQAVVKSENMICSVKADIGGVETVSLNPSPMALGGINAMGTIGLYQAEWIGHDLQEKVYNIKITVTDILGHSYTDSSLEFSDPAAGNSNIGNHSYETEQFVRIGSCNGNSGENLFNCSVVDTINGYAYFGTWTTPGKVVKVALGSGSTSPSRISSLTLQSGENDLSSAVIDPVHGFAYFGTATSPGRVIKIALGSGAAAPTRVGAVTLSSGEDYLYSGVIDPEHGYAYFGTFTGPGIVVKVALGSGATAPTRVGAVTLRSSGEDYLSCGVIDPEHGYAYFGTWLGWSKIVKIALGNGSIPPTRVESIPCGLTNLSCAVIDTVNGYVYFGSDTSPGEIVKIAIGSDSLFPEKIGSITLRSGEDSLRSAAIDIENGYAYFGANSSPGKIVKVALGIGDAYPQRIDTIDVNSGEDQLRSAALDPENGYAYFGTYTSVGKVVKVSTSCGAPIPSRTGAVTLEAGEDKIRTGVLDSANGYAYFGTETSPGIIIKVALGDEFTAPSRVGAIGLYSGENDIYSAAIDTIHGYAYFGTKTDPGRVVKIALGSGGTAPSRVGALTLNTGESNLRSAIVDPANGYGYFGTGTSPGQVVKVALGSGATVPSRVGAVTLNSGEDNLWNAAVIDPGNGYAYFGTGTSPGIVVKVALGSGSDAPSRIGAVTLNSGEDNLRTAVADIANGYAYFGTLTTPGKVVKVALGSGSADPSRVGAVTLNTNEDNLRTATIDTANGFAYFGTFTTAGSIVKVALGSGSTAPSRVNGLEFVGGENNLISAIMDPSSGYAYFGTYTTPGVVVKTRLSINNYIFGEKITLSERASLNDIRFYSHAAGGNVRLSIYDDNGTTKTTKWESGSIANDKTNDWITAAISSGTPSSLVLNPGTYWLAFNTDSPKNFESATRTKSSNGFLMNYLYSAFPQKIRNSETKNCNINFGHYLTYEQVSDLTVASDHGSPSPAIGTTVCVNGSTVNASVASPVSGGTGVQYICTGWTGTGDAPSTGTLTSCSFTINQASTITWNWKTQYQLTIATEPTSLLAGCSVTPAAGIHWYDSGALALLEASSATGSPHFIGWTGSITSSNLNESITMDFPKSITATFGLPNTSVNDWIFVDK